MISLAKRKKAEEKQAPAWVRGCSLLNCTPIGDLMGWQTVYCDNRYPIGRDDWAYVDSLGHVYLNPAKKANEKEWAYVVAHCLMHLALGHIREDKNHDCCWNTACDMVVTAYLKDGGFGAPPPEFQRPLPFTVRDEEQLAESLRFSNEKYHYGTTAPGRCDMVWKGKSRVDFTEVFSRALQRSMRQTLRSASGAGAERGKDGWDADTPYGQARLWFIAGYPLLGALAAAFRIVDDAETVRRLDIPVAAISAQMEEIYINPNCPLSLDEWKFVLAHEFLHAALRHDLRCGDRHPELWNVACDYVVNGWLAAMHVGSMPDFVLYDTDFSRMTAEAVYDKICEDVRYYTKRNPGDIIYGDADFWENTRGAELDEYYRSAVSRGLACHEQRFGRGLLPAGLVEDIHALSCPPIRWDVELAKWFDGHFLPLEKHRSYARLSRRQSSAPDIPRPAWRMDEEAQEQRIYGVLLDTSGSMDRHLLAAALGSIASYSEARDVKHIRVVFCDAAPYDQGIMSPDAIAGSVKVLGRGGTRLQPGIDLLDNDPKFPKEAPLLIITDGAIDRLDLHGREHAYLLPLGCHLPFPPRGPVFKLK